MKANYAMTTRERKAYDRGSATRYYGRTPRPHIWTSNDPQALKVIPLEDMTEAEVQAFWLGYEQETDRKDYG
jgi:3'-phosphoadenosine 5'-phosphosulfate sulfotransferase (PAPS reductase)/FAD synthetase